MPVKLGELLLKENMVTPQQLQEALSHQKMNGGKLGKAFVSLGYVRDEEITSLLSRQYGVPSINLDHFEVDPAIIKTSPFHADVETTGELTVGRTVIDTHRRRGMEPNANVALDADGEKFVRMLMETFARMPPGSAA